MEQRDLFGNIIPSLKRDKINSGLTKIENGEYFFYPNFFSKSESDLFLQKLKDEIEWKQETMNMYGKQVNFPRLTAWYGNKDKPYSFSGITLQPKVWSKELLEIKSTGISIERCERLVLKNNYTIEAKKHYLINPIYRFKFGWKPKEQYSLVQKIPFFRNFLTTCVYYLIRK